MPYIATSSFLPPVAMHLVTSSDALCYYNLFGTSNDMYIMTSFCAGSSKPWETLPEASVWHREKPQPLAARHTDIPWPLCSESATEIGMQPVMASNEKHPPKAIQVALIGSPSRLQ